MGRIKEGLSVAVLVVGLVGSLWHGYRYLWEHLAPVGKMTASQLVDAAFPMSIVLVITGWALTIYYRLEGGIGKREFAVRATMTHALSEQYSELSKLMFDGRISSSSDWASLDCTGQVRVDRPIRGQITQLPSPLV